MCSSMLIYANVRRIAHTFIECMLRLLFAYCAYDCLNAEWKKRTTHEIYYVHIFLGFFFFFFPPTLACLFCECVLLVLLFVESITFNGSFFRFHYFVAEASLLFLYTGALVASCYCCWNVFYQFGEVEDERRTTNDFHFNCALCIWWVRIQHICFLNMRVYTFVHMNGKNECELCVSLARHTI